MRHLLGVGLAIVLAAAVFFAASWGYLKLLTARTRLGALPPGGGSLLHDHAVLEGFGALLLVGLAGGVLMAGPRLSPLLADWSQTQTRPQHPVDPNGPGRSQAPWGPADYS